MYNSLLLHICVTASPCEMFCKYKEVVYTSTRAETSSDFNDQICRRGNSSTAKVYFTVILYFSNNVSDTVI